MAIIYSRNSRKVEYISKNILGEVNMFFCGRGVTDVWGIEPSSPLQDPSMI